MEESSSRKWRHSSKEPQNCPQRQLGVLDIILNYLFDNLVTSYFTGSQSNTFIYRNNLQNKKQILVNIFREKLNQINICVNLFELLLLIHNLNTFTRVRLCGYFVCHTVETVSSSVQLNIVTATVMKQQSACCLRVKQKERDEHRSCWSLREAKKTTGEIQLQ